MKILRNSMMTTIPLLSIALLVVVPISDAQQLNQVRAYIEPSEIQPSYFPSEQQIQQALAPKTVTFAVQPSSYFPPLVKQPQAFINQFSTPDAPRLKAMPSFAALNGMTRGMALRRKYNLPNKGYFSQNRALFPALPPPTYGAMTNFPQPRFPLNPLGGRLPTHFGAINNNALSTLPFRSNRIRDTFVGMPNNNRKKQGANKPNILPDFYTNFTGNLSNDPMSAPQELGRIPNNWRVPYTNRPDSVAVSNAITHQFPPVVEASRGRLDPFQWIVVDGD